MTAVKKLALGVCVLGITSTSVQAGPMSRSGSSSGWITWISNRPSASSGSYTISGPPVLNVFNAAQAPTPPAPAPVAAPDASTGTLSLVASDAPVPIAVPTPISAPAYTPQLSNVIEAPPMTVAASVASTFAAIPSSAPIDAYINMTGGPYPNASILTTGAAQAWYNSPSAIQAFGGVPNAQQQTSFDQAVLSHVEQTFQLSGMNPTITLDPNANALHTISVVSNTSNGSDPNAIGMTEVGGNGFGYIDKLASLNLNSDQLAWAVAHNISHELMHAFGIAIHPDQTGTYIDAESASVSVLTNPNTTFSPAADQLIKATDYGVNVSGTSIGAEKLTTNSNYGSVNAQAQESPVPEPSAIFVWGASLAAAGLVFHRKRNSNRAA